MHDQPNPAVPAPARTHKRCPACGVRKPLSGYCKSCQRAISRRSRRRRNAALRALIALHPEEWRAALQRDHGEPTVGGGSDVA